MSVVLPYAVLLATILYASVLAAMGKDVRKVSIMSLVIALAASAIPGGGTFYGTLVVNDFAVFFNVIYLLSALLIALFSVPFMKDSGYYLLLLFSTFGMMVVSSTTNLVAIYAALEMVALASYALIVSARNEESSEAGIKYFIITIFSSAVMLFGLALLYSSGGSVDLASMAVHATPLTLLAIVLLTAGLGFKAGAAPFNLWIPDVYQGSPGPIAGLLAGAAKKAGFAALFLIFFLVLRAPELMRYWVLPWAFLALLTMTLGNVAALAQDNVKRLLAYSIIGQSGYIMMGLAAVGRLGLMGGLFHSFTHAFMVIGSFFIIALLSMKGLNTIEDYNGLAKRSPFLATSLLVFLASLAGIPPLAGFVSKFILFSAAVGAGMGWLTLAAVLNSAVSVYYYFKVARAMYSEGQGGALEVPAEAKTAVAACVLLLIVFGIYPNPILNLIEGAVKVFGF